MTASLAGIGLAVVTTVGLAACSHTAPGPTGRAALPGRLVQTEQHARLVVVEWNNEVSACVVDPPRASVRETAHAVTIRIFERAFNLKRDEACGGVGEAGTLRVALRTPIDGRLITGATTPALHERTPRVPGVIGLSPRQARTVLADDELTAVLPRVPGAEVVAQNPSANADPGSGRRVRLSTGR